MKRLTKSIAASLAVIALSAGLSSAQANTTAPDLEHMVPGVTYTAEQLGMKIDVPPAGFDPVTASDADLAKYHFPARPDKTTHPAEYAKWYAHMSKVKNLKFIVPEFKALGQKAGTITPYSDPIWSGYVARTTAATGVQADLFVPTLSSAGQPLGTTAYSVHWVGLGGYGENSVIQNGVGAYENVDSQGGTTPVYFAWWEVYPWNGITALANFNVYPGDYCYFETDYNPSNGSATFTFYDYTQSEYTIFTPNNGGTPINFSQYYHGDYAEWISELPQSYPSGQPFPYLANFGTAQYVDPMVKENSSWNPDYDYNLLQLYMYNPATGNHRDDTNSLDSNGSFTITWKHYN